MKQLIKAKLLGKSSSIRKIVFGPAAGLRMRIDPLNKSQRIFGLDEREISSAFVSFSRNSDVFIDIGSSDGYYGLIFKKFNKAATIISCDSKTAFKEEQINNYRINQFDISETFQFVDRVIGEFVNESKMTIDHLLYRSFFSAPFLKIDVDGGELDVLKGAIDTLSLRSCKLIIETHSLDLENQCAEFLLSVGYASRIVRNAWWRAIVPEKRDLPHNRWLLSSKMK